MSHCCCRHIGDCGLRSHDPVLCGAEARWVDVSRATPRFLCGRHRGPKRGFRHTDIVPIPIDVWELAQSLHVDVFVTRDHRAWEATIEGESIRVSCVYYTPPDDDFWNHVRHDLRELRELRENVNT